MNRILDPLFARVRREPFFWRFTVFTRILLAAGFIPTGLVKLLGQRFTSMTSGPIAEFFEAMYQTGAYWQFLGGSQVLAGVLLLFPRLAHLGAALFLPIMANIFVITVAVGFNGTPFVTALMLLAVMYLCAWDYHRFRAMVTTAPWPEDLEIAMPRLDPWERVGFVLFAASMLAFWTAGRFGQPSLLKAPILVGVGAGFFTFVRFLFVRLRLRAAAASSA